MKKLSYLLVAILSVYIFYSGFSSFSSDQINRMNSFATSIGYIKLLVLILFSICYFAFYDYSVTPMIILALIGICIMLIVMKRRFKFRKS